MEFWDNLKALTNPETIIHIGGLAMLLLVIFAENGLVIGFFLPGDSLIFLSGIICAADRKLRVAGKIEEQLIGVDVASLLVFMTAAAILGSLAGYYFGYKVGPRLFDRKDSILFKKKYLDMTQKFYDKYGGKTLVLGRFLPIIRTFSPILAGVIKVRFPIFMLYNFVGASLWITSLCLLGYYMGSQFPLIEHYLGYIIIGFIGITSVILVRTYLRQRRSNKRTNFE